jgi:crooked neck
MPENVWKAFIDMEIALDEKERVRELYRRLLERSKHVKVWLSQAKFEAEEAANVDMARARYQEAYLYFKNS